jgi:epoxyqueuosine reductase
MITTLTSRIREAARQLGFFKMGITAAKPLPDRERFDWWLEQGMQGEMRYLGRQAAKRKDPGLVMSSTRSILSLAMNYYSEDPPPDNVLKGRISRHAWGDDYHHLVESRLDELLRFIRRIEPSAEGLCYVDTGPVMEKVWGAHSALGWMGKHTNLITRDEGSWFFMGVILLNLELECDQKESDFCGSCTRCMRVCPAGAIVAPYVLDARLCISYLTIELRGSIPRDLRPSIGNRIYGCDSCQEVCPWNRFAVRTDEESFHAQKENMILELAPLASITADEFSRRFKKSPILRLRRDAFVRNVAVALGNSGSAEAVPALKIAIQDRSALVRVHAAWALGQIAANEARQALLDAKAVESDPAVLEEINFGGRE